MLRSTAASRWPTFIAVLLTLALAPLSAEPALAPSEDYQRATDALANGLPEVAAESFQKALDSLAEEHPNRPALELKLAEAWVRAGKAQQALALLSRPELGELPERDFWLAEALAIGGQFERALASFRSYLARNTGQFRLEAAKSAASLLLAMDEANTAFELVEDLESDPSPDLRLLLAEIALRQGNAERALVFLTPILAERSSPLRSPAAYIQARSLLQLGRAKEALAASQAIQTDPIPGAKAMLEALAQHLDNKDPAALDALLSLIKETPDSPFIPNGFQLLLSLDLEPTQATLERLDRWTESPQAGLAAEALFARASLRSRSQSTQPQAITDLKQLIQSHPSHYLESPAKWQLALLYAKAQQQADSIKVLDDLLQTSISPAIRNRARLLKASLLAEQDTPAQAIELLQAMDEGSEQDLLDRALFNASLLSSLSSSSSIQPPRALPPAYQARLAFEFALSHAAQQKVGAIELLDQAIAKYPESALLKRAQISLASLLLDQPDSPSEKITSIMEALENSPPDGKLGDSYQRLRLTYLRHQKQWATLIEEAKSYLQEQPDSPFAPRIQLELGMAYFDSGEFNQAQLIFTNLARDPKVEDRLRLNANYLSALAASRTGTAQALEQAVEIYDEVAKDPGPVGARARLNAAEILFKRLGKNKEAIERIVPLTRSKVAPYRRQAMSLQAEILGANARSSEPDYTAALAILDQLLKEPELSNSWRQRSLIRRAEISELAGRPEQALKDYFRVLTPSPAGEGADAYFFERAGFACMRLLEAQGRWQAAAKMADRLTEAAGPRAQEAAERGRKLREDQP